MRELLTAIGLTASFTAEINLRVRVGLPIIEPAFFLRSACPAFLSPAEAQRRASISVVNRVGCSNSRSIWLKQG